MEIQFLNLAFQISLCAKTPLKLKLLQSKDKTYSVESSKLSYCSRDQGGCFKVTTKSYKVGTLRAKSRRRQLTTRNVVKLAVLYSFKAI